MRLLDGYVIGYTLSAITIAVIIAVKHLLPLQINKTQLMIDTSSSDYSQVGLALYCRCCIILYMYWHFYHKTLQRYCFNSSDNGRYTDHANRCCQPSFFPQLASIELCCLQTIDPPYRVPTPHCCICLLRRSSHDCLPWSCKQLTACAALGTTLFVLSLLSVYFHSMSNN